MSPALAQLIVVAGPQLVAVVIDLFKTMKDKSPEAITPEQWTELQALFSESYDARVDRIKKELIKSGQLPH